MLVLLLLFIMKNFKCQRFIILVDWKLTGCCWKLFGLLNKWYYHCKCYRHYIQWINIWPAHKMISWINYYCTTKHLPSFTIFRLQDVFEVQIGKVILLITLILHFFQFKQFNSKVGLGGNETHVLICCWSVTNSTATNNIVKSPFFFVRYFFLL